MAKRIAPAATPATPAATPAAATPAAVPPGVNPENGVQKYTSLADQPLQLPPGAKPEKGMTVAGAPAAPAAGSVGQSLEKLGVTKQQRLDQAFVDQKLGAGKFKAGSAEANTALLKAMQVKKESRLSEDPELTAMLRIAGLR